MYILLIGAYFIIGFIITWFLDESFIHHINEFTLVQRLRYKLSRDKFYVGVLILWPIFLLFLFYKWLTT